MNTRNKKALVLVTGLMTCAAASAQPGPDYTWRYYRPSNTGIQGDYNEAIWVGPDNDPWMGGYNPFFEEGGIAKFVQAENRWINISNVDYPVIGHPDDTGTSRVSDIVPDGEGNLWLGTWRGALRFNPASGPSSLVNYGPGNSALPGGRTSDVDVAPDGTIWFTAISVSWGSGGVTRYNPANDTWAYWPLGETHIAAQPNQSGGYYVWSAGRYSGFVFRYDSTSQTWTTLPQTGAPGEVAALPGKDCTDDAGNLWMLRVTSPGAYHSLDYRRPHGTWVAPPEPYAGITFDIWAFKAFGSAQALLCDGNGNVWRFDGTSWSSLGQWRPGAYTDSLDIDAEGNVWVAGTGGAARRDATTGVWQRYRVTNTSQYDFFNRDLAIEQDSGAVYACANAGAGYGGMVKFDGTRWIGVNNHTYGLGIPWPFPTDNSESVAARPTLGPGAFAVNPTFNGIHQYDGVAWTMLLQSGTSRGMVEDSLGRLWSIGEYFDLRYHDGSRWTTVPILGWGSRIQRDPDRPGTIWAATGYETVRADGSYYFSRTIADFPELTTQSDYFSGLAADRKGVVWIGCTVQLGVGGTGGGLIRIDSSSGTYQMLRYDQGWPLPGQYVSPLCVAPDGRVWMQFDTNYPYTERGLCWYDGTTVGIFPAPSGGEPQWGGLPHAQIEAADVRVLPDGYEIWLSCASRGIAVLTVTGTVLPGDFDGDGDVDLSDFVSFQLCFGGSKNPPAPTCPPGIDADLDDDGDVDLADFLIFQQNFTGSL